MATTPEPAWEEARQACVAEAQKVYDGCMGMLTKHGTSCAEHMAETAQTIRGRISALDNPYRGKPDALAALNKQYQQTLRDLIEADVQLAYWWDSTGSCPCGARRESPRTHPHVSGCPTAKAIERTKQ